MSYLSKANLAYSQVAIPPSPALSGTTLTLANGEGALFPSANFTITIYPPNTLTAVVNPLASNAEICLCTSRTGDVLTIVRAQEGSTAKSIKAGWQVANSATKLNFTEIENSIIQNISAGTAMAGAGTVVFSNSNNVSFGVNGQTITAQAVAGAAISAGASSQGTGTIQFSNSNGVSFGLNAGTLTASVSAAANPAFSASGGSSTFQTLNFANSNGFTFSNSNGSVIGSYTVPTQSTQPVAASASNGSFVFSTLGFSNANGVTFGTSAGSQITASVAAGAAAGSIAAGGSTLGLGQVVFSNSNGVSFSLNGSTITASHNGLTSQSNQAASASNGSFTFQTLGFSNANNVTFGTSAGSIITASVGTAAGGVAISAGAASQNTGTIVFSNSNGVSFGLNAGTLTASHNGITSQSAQPVAASASNGSFTFSTLGFSNANGVTFGTSAGSIVTASVGVAAGGATNSMTVFPGPFPGTCTQSISYPNGTVVFDPFTLPSAISFNSIQQLVNGFAAFGPANLTTSTSGGLSMVIDYMFYTRSVTDSAATNFSNSSILASISSIRWSMNVTSSGSASSKGFTYNMMTDSTGGASTFSFSTNASNLMPGPMTNRMVFAVPFKASFPAGDYWVGRRCQSTTNEASASLGWIPHFNEITLFGAVSTLLSTVGDTGNGNVNGNNNPTPGLGIYSVTTAAMPATVNIVNDLRNPVNISYRWYVLRP